MAAEVTDRRRDERIDNENFYSYYLTTQTELLPTDQHEAFRNFCREPLPVTFRVIAHTPHEQWIKKLVLEAQETLTALASKQPCPISPDDGNSATTVMPTLTALDWYKYGTAYQFSANRKTLRSIPEIKKFSEFLTTQSENGSIIRQETVSMVPATFIMDEIHSPNVAVLDLCAAPGSKTSQLLEQLASKALDGAENSDQQIQFPSGVVVANDLNSTRAHMMVHHLRYHNSPELLVTLHNAAHFPNLFIGEERQRFQFDHVLCDVPCSGDGTVRKSPNAMKNWSAANGLALHPLQLTVLKRGLALCKPGGRIVYSTCSLNPIEDEAVVAETLRIGNGSVELETAQINGLITAQGVTSWKVPDRTGAVAFNDENEYQQHQTASGPTKKKGGPRIFPSMFQPTSDDVKIQLVRCMRIYPHLNNTGGFFVAVFRKKSAVPWEETPRQDNATRQEIIDDQNSVQPDAQQKDTYVPNFYTQTDLQCMSCPEAHTFQDSFKTVCSTYGLTYDTHLTDLLWARSPQIETQNSPSVAQPLQNETQELQSEKRNTLKSGEVVARESVEREEPDSTRCRIPRKVWLVTSGVRKLLMATTRRSKLKVMHAGLVFSECRKVNQVRMTSAGFRTALRCLQYHGIQASFREDTNVKVISPELLELLVLGLTQQPDENGTSPDETAKSVTEDSKIATEDNEDTKKIPVEADSKTDDEIKKAAEDRYRVNVAYLPEEDARRQALQALRKDRHYIFAVQLDAGQIFVPCYVGKSNSELLVSLPVRHALADLVRSPL